MVKAHTSGDIRHLGHVAFKANVKRRSSRLTGISDRLVKGGFHGFPVPGESAGAFGFDKQILHPQGG